MLSRKKLKIKFLAILIAVLLTFNPVIAPLVWAAEEESPPVEDPVVQEEQPQEEPPVVVGTGSETSEPQEEKPVEEPQGEPEPGISAQTEEPQDAGDSTIETGDAESLAEVETTANTNLDCVCGEISTPEDPCSPPEAETECPEGAEISNDNTAEVSDEADSTATTGDNLIQGSEGDALIDTGDATAGASINNNINNNVVVFQDEETEVETGEEGETEEQVEEALEEENPAVVVENENEGTLTNDVDVLADTGDNQANESDGSATIATGDALAWANLLNFLNTNIVGSNFEILLLDLLENHNGNVNLNQLWKEILEKGGEDSLSLADESNFSNLDLLVKNLNQAYLENNVDVAAETGENQANENSQAEIGTGDATALSNTTNFVNTNILGSEFFLGVINILGSFEGDLVLPRPENFGLNGGLSEQNSSGPPVIFSNQNQAEVEDQVISEADTGENEETGSGGNSLIETGNAKARANSFSFVNLNILRNNWFFLIINNLGNWHGKIFGWSAPSAQEEPNGESQIFELGMDEPTLGVEQDLQIENDLPLISFENQNQAQVVNNINTSASTGENQASENEGGASIETGNATALSNLFNFINLNILGGRWFMGLVNVLGDWGGDAVFAYPDVTVSISDGVEQVSPGDVVEYSLIYKNQGYDLAGGVVVSFELPEGVSYIGDSSGTPPSVSDNTYSWLVGNLEMGEEGSFNIQVQVEPDFSPAEEISLLERLMPKAYAAEAEASFVVSAEVFTTDPESDTGNNTATETTVVYFPDEEPGVDNRLPVLEISAWNNVGEFVYPGDTVTFEITIKNTSDVAAYDVYLAQELYNGVPEDSFGTAGFEIGTLEAGQGGRLTFGLKLEDNGILPEGPYYTIVQAFGNAPNGTPVSSNQARTDFEVRHKVLSSLFEAKAVGKEEEGEILGVLGSEDTCPEDENLLPYVLLFLLSSLWISGRSKRYLKVKS